MSPFEELEELQRNIEGCGMSSVYDLLGYANKAVYIIDTNYSNYVGKFGDPIFTEYSSMLKNKQLMELGASRYFNAKRPTKATKEEFRRCKGGVLYLKNFLHYLKQEIDKQV